MTNETKDRAESATESAAGAATKKSTKTAAKTPSTRKGATTKSAGKTTAKSTAKKTAPSKAAEHDTKTPPVSDSPKTEQASESTAKSAAKKSAATRGVKKATTKSTAKTAPDATPDTEKKSSRQPAKKTAGKTAGTTKSTAAKRSTTAATAKAAADAVNEAPAVAEQDAAPAKKAKAASGTGRAGKTSSGSTKKVAAKTKPVAENDATPAAIEEETKPAPKRATSSKKTHSASAAKPAARPAKQTASPQPANDAEAPAGEAAPAPQEPAAQASRSAGSTTRTQQSRKSKSSAGRTKQAQPRPRSIAEADAMLAREKAARSAAKESDAPKATQQPEQQSEPQTEQRDTRQQESQNPADSVVPANTTASETAETDSTAVSEEHAAAEGSAENASAEGEQKRRRRSRRGGRRRNKKSGTAANGEEADSSEAPEEEDGQDVATDTETTQTVESDADADATEAADAEPKASQKGKQTSTKGQASGKTSGKSDKSTAKSGESSKEAESAKGKGSDKLNRRKMFISILSGQQVEVVLTEEGQVQEYYVEMTHQAKIKGNIYKGVISNVDANLQAAFVSYGGVKNGFLQIDEVHPEYYQVPHDGKGRKYPLIQKALKPGQEILVQVVKEPAGTKGAFLTSYLSLPGRFLVLTPGREQIGVSRKVDNEEERARLREMLTGLKPGPGLGVIVRTVSMGATKTSLQRDLQFLKRLWKEVRSKGLETQAPSLIYQELDLATRSIRDYLTDEVNEVWVDDGKMAETMQEMADMLFPRKNSLVHVHKDSEQGQTLFERFSLQKQLDQIYSREVVLPSGGRLVFDHTEALTAIDINSSKSGGKNNFEDMAYRTNIEAARMIPLQLRLRDIGGQVVADFIEMRERDHWREVEKAVRNGMKGDRARYDVGKMGPFGMLEIVRQRLGSSAISVSTEPCPCCKGTGVRRNMEWQAMRALRDIQKIMRQAAAQKQETASYATESELALHLLNTKRSSLEALEKEFGIRLSITIGV